MYYNERIFWEKEETKDMIINAAFQAILDNTKDIIFVKDKNLLYVAASMPFVKMVGKKSVEEILGKTDIEIFADQNLAKKYVTDDKKLMESGKSLQDYIEPLTEEKGKARYGSTSKHILKDKDGNGIGILGITKDITKDYVTRQRYQQELRYLFKLPEDTYAVSYIDVDSWRIITQRRQIIGEGTLQSCFSVEELCQAAVESIAEKACEAVRFYENFTQDALRQINDDGRSNISFQYQRHLSDGTVHWIQNEIRFLTDADSGHLCAMLTAKDIDAKKQEEQKLQEAARMDKMTMLLNRETTLENIRQILKKEPNQVHVLYMIDIDNFKQLNDTLGHQSGDKFLMGLAAEIKKCYRESDVVGRIGGDEFFAFLQNVSERTIIEEKAQELLASIQHTCAAYPNIKLSGSVGISMYPENGTTLEELYARADVALYQAKRKGKNQFIFAE